jgi:hypothetical protein
MKPIDPDILWKAFERDKEQIVLLTRIGEALYGDRWADPIGEGIGYVQSDRETLGLMRSADPLAVTRRNPSMSLPGQS